MVCKLKNALCGLKQAPRDWYTRFGGYLLKKGFQKGIADKNIYFKAEENDILIVVVYVDDIMFKGNDGMCKKFVDEIQEEIEISMIREMNIFIGLQVI